MCLDEILAGRRKTLTSARANLFSNRDGLSAKTGIHWVLARVPMLAETIHLAVDMVERGNYVELPDGEVILAEAVAVGEKGQEKMPKTICNAG